MVSASIYKAKPDNFKRLSRKFKKVKSIVFEKEKIRGYNYIKKERRFEILNEIRRIVKNYDLKFGTCREGFDFLKDTVSCDPIFEPF